MSGKTVRYFRRPYQGFYVCHYLYKYPPPPQLVSPPLIPVHEEFWCGYSRPHKHNTYASLDLVDLHKTPHNCLGKEEALLTGRTLLINVRREGIIQREEKRQVILPPLQFLWVTGTSRVVEHLAWWLDCILNPSHADPCQQHSTRIEGVAGFTPSMILPWVRWILQRLWWLWKETIPPARPIAKVGFNGPHTLQKSGWWDGSPWLHCTLSLKLPCWTSNNIALWPAIWEREGGVGSGNYDITSVRIMNHVNVSLL